MVEIYTDASVGKTGAFATAFVLTDKNYLGYKVSEFPDVTTSIQGETKGAIAAIKYAVQGIGKSEDSLTLYTDSMALLNLLKCNLERTTNEQAQRYKEDLSELKDLIKRHSVSMQFVRGHDIGHNPNKVVDLISNSMLRLSKKGV